MRPEDQSGILEALLRPTFKRIPESLQAREGQTVRLDTIVSGRPAPELLWYRDGQPVHNDMNHKVCCHGYLRGQRLKKLRQETVGFG